MSKIKIRNVRDVLNEIKWTKEINKAEIWYIHRGSPNNIKVISGREIKIIGKSFIDTNSASIPFHRIFKIKYGSNIIFERK